eukprot:TRINITY_DN6134_c0_g1_i3.p1 TRINITY_DN6134_c0_g1~~TRINITY_DN6134_c0_g1_i3.p1  ORF type:complete len:698 (-),score=172.61 TRINITY_DN6134_c0_g1_i3:1294-3387(-)
MADTDEALEKQAQAMAEKTLPASLPEAVRAAKIPALVAKLLERLKKQRDDKRAAAAAGAAVPAAAPTGAAAAPAASGAAPPPPPPGAPPAEMALLRIPGVELFGDEPWYADADMRKRLRDSVVEAHREEKILVGPPADEVARICPSEDRTLMAGAVLRLGGAHQGGYGEPDVAYAYRQLSRALHPDKNPNIPNASVAFMRLREAADELRAGLTEQRNVLNQLAGLTGVTVTDETSARPQEAIFAEAVRVLSAVSLLCGEGKVPQEAAARAALSFMRNRAFPSCQPQALMNAWFEKPDTLEIYGGTSLRTAYDCAPKRMRAQFLCLLNRMLALEAQRNGDECIRSGWNAVMQNFPELVLWRNFRDLLSAYVWSGEGAPPPADEEEPVEPTPPPEPEMDPQEKAMKMLELTWQACSGPDFQSAYEQLRKRGKMSLQIGLAQLMEQATAEATSKFGPGVDKDKWKFKDTVELCKRVGENSALKKKAYEIERLIGQIPGKLFGMKASSRSRSRTRSKSRKRSPSRRRRRRRGRSRSRSRSRRRSRSRSRQKKDGAANGEAKKDAGKAAVKTDDKASADKKSKWDTGASGEARIPGRTLDGRPTYRRRWDQTTDDPTRRCSAWCRRWRRALAAIVPSAFDGALPLMHAEMRTLVAAMWKEIAAWAESSEGCRGLGLFRADKQTAQTFGWDAGKPAPRVAYTI